jgi:hypothetical protein
VLPDGKFSYHKYQFGKILEGVGMKNVGISPPVLVCFARFTKKNLAALIVQS